MEPFEILISIFSGVAIIILAAGLIAIFQMRDSLSRLEVRFDILVDSHSNLKKEVKEIRDRVISTHGA